MLIIGVLLVLTLSACSNDSGANGGKEELTTPISTDSEMPTPSATITDTVTPTTLPLTVLFLAPNGSDPELVSDLEILLAELTEVDGFELEIVSEQVGEGINENTKIVVAVAPDQGIQELALAVPQTQFLAVGIPGVEPLNNLSTIGASGTRPDQQGFIAGYLAATITPDWRTGVISTADTVSGVTARKAFINGVIFFCGLCRASRPPFIEYPQFFEIPSSAGQAEMQSAADYLITNAVQTVYLSSEAGNQELYEYLAQAGVIMIGGEAPPASVRGQWAATIGSDWLTPVRELWPRLLAGEAGIGVDVPLSIEEINPDLFSPGRQRLVNETLSDLLSNYIDTGVDPLTGETK